jgi:hypothetical protein
MCQYEGVPVPKMLKSLLGIKCSELNNNTTNHAQHADREKEKAVRGIDKMTLNRTEKQRK